MVAPDRQRAESIANSDYMQTWARWNNGEIRIIDREAA
jgi:hypothetical protein